MDAPVKKTLEERGIYLFHGYVDESSCEKAVRWILERNFAEDEKLEQLTLVINSPGGSCDAGFGLVDVMVGSRIPVITVGMGLVASMGLMLFIAGKKGTRTLTPNTMILSHQWSWGYVGKEHELIASQRSTELAQEMVMRHYKRHTGLSERVIRKVLLPPHDVWLSAEEAKKYGCCDIIKSF